MENDPMNDAGISKMYQCAPLLPEPGPEVVRELIDEIRRERKQVRELYESLPNHPFYDKTTRNKMRELWPWLAGSEGE